ncbi:hypothetical protein OG311_00685 [Streptomyces sp. NBC_01343]|uniref:hypothetical protein n=1 Tax=Streptomyces sp. NBC_01343 TaxID=2903832 RepID=UPI002E0DC73A|nr:hypothetical protein OG311_00685 [Streptomyces sp. NBC_01343]
MQEGLGVVGLRLSRLLDEEGIDHVAIAIAIAIAIDDETREALALFESESRRSYHIVPPGPHLHDHARPATAPPSSTRRLCPASL